MQDASVRFGELLDACASQVPQILTRHGAEIAVLVPIAEWQRLCGTARPSLKSLLLSDFGRVDFESNGHGKGYPKK